MKPLSRTLLQNMGWSIKGNIAYMQLESPKVRLGWMTDGTFIFGYGQWPRKVTTLEYLQQIIKLIEQ